MSAADDQDELPSAAVPAESAKNSSRPLEAGGFAAEALEIARRVKQISRNEAHLTAGCGYNTKKKLLLSAFWDGMWPELTSIGWQKIHGVEESEGSIKFFPPPLDGTKKDVADLPKDGRRGKDFYDRIIDVIEKIQMRRNADEARAADRFSRAQELQQAKRKTIRSSSGKKKKRRTKVSSASSTGSNSSDDAPVVTLRRRQPSLVASTMDLTWKLGGALYPKQSSRVGDEYQVTELPAPGTAGKGDQSDLYELLYDPSNPNAAVVDKVLSGSIPVNKKERFFEKIGSTAMRSTSEFVCDNVQTLVQGLEPCDGSDWTIEEKALFHREVFRLRKDLKALSKVMGKDLKSCYTYYLSTFKKSNDYRALKVVREQERAGDSGSNVHGVDACAICGDGGSLIICDSCDGDYHINCLRPRLRAVPEGHWECDECVDRKLLEARDRIIANTKLYEQHGSHSNSATAEQPSSNEIAMRPSAGVLGAIKAFADGIDAVFNQKSQPIHEESQDETNTPKQKQDSVQETGTPLLHETAIEAA